MQNNKERIAHVAILLSVYNGEHYLDDLLKSISNQETDAQITIYARDDGSNDSSREILNKWSKQLKIIIIKGKNKGPRDSFRELIGRVPFFDYYAFCDQDDLWYPDKVSSAIKMMKKCDGTKPILYFCNVENVDAEGCPLGINRINNNPEIGISNVVVENPALGCTMFFNYSLLKDMLKVNFKYYYMHDVVAIDLAAILGTIIYDPLPRMGYRQHMSSYTQGHNKLKRYKNAFIFWFCSKDISIENQSREILQVFDVGSNKEDVEMMANYKKGFNRFKLAMNNKFRTKNYNCNRSFIMRVLLGVA